MLRLCLLLALFVSCSFSQFKFPTPILQALKPKGFRITIKDRPDIELFAFHARINEAISSNVIGDISTDIRQNNGKLIYYDPDLQLKTGDVINYWTYVQAGPAGFVQSDKSWVVKELVGSDGEGCANPVTASAFVDQNSCVGSVFFDDDFNGSEINRSMWTVEQYIPSYFEDNYEFVSYEDINKCRFLSNSKIFLKPISRNDVRGMLDFRGKCTKSIPIACQHEQLGASILPPVRSAKITSKMSFKYGRVEIRAKLPIGDWIYPQIELIPVTPGKQYPKILMAYARGNEKLLLVNGFDIGSRTLWGGYITSSEEPKRSGSLKSTQMSSPVGQDMHVFTVVWTPNKIQFMVDNKVYGEELNFNTDDEYQISLGVGVGGVVDFPDSTQSGSFAKPWTNFHAKQMTAFHDAKSSWINTWHGDNVALQVDYVRVSSV